ncbi:MAG: sensor histidine kinase [Anaerolineae bacterium]|nr:sensor histidine kinase [Anaerolineae bacterium]
MVFEEDPELGVVMVDEALVSRILLNLLSNAIKYSPDGGQIVLRLGRSEDHIVLMVQDEGVGISPETQAQLFLPFFRGAEVQHIKGTGLGLSIVKDCVDRHHGRIRVESTPGQGSTFIVELPFHPPDTPFN